MRLIATMGASGIDKKHKYIIDNKVYESELSFMALAKAYNIEDIIVIGTSKSEEKITSILESHQN